MKKILLSILFLAGLATAEAQTVCTPNTNLKEPGMYPSNLPDAKVNVMYSEVIQFKFPKDTSAFGGVADIDSIRLARVDSMPKDFVFECSKPRCSYLGGENGCVVVKGNPKADMIGNYTIYITGQAYARYGGVPLPPQDFTRSIELNIVSASALYANKKNVSNIFEVKQNQPNPFGNTTLIEYSSPGVQAVSFKVYDIVGHQVYNKEMMATAGDNTVKFERNNLKSGIYFYSLQMGEKLITKKMTIRD
ncbi:MAG: T9SS type A sorting domain-containing protein [Sphingobacteriales bacterium]|nr:MAG: T9SS type A sorting domain-containing protein [Sphingobacteriales bacterium]